MFYFNAISVIPLRFLPYWLQVQTRTRFSLHPELQCVDLPKKGKCFWNLTQSWQRRSNTCTKRVFSPAFSTKTVRSCIHSYKIQCRHVMGGHLLVSGKNVCNHFEDCQDSGFYVSDEAINAILALPIEKVHSPFHIYVSLIIFIRGGPVFQIYDLGFKVKVLVSILACQDRTLRILEKGKLKFTVNLPSIPSTLDLLNGDGGESGWDIIFGTMEGRFGMITLSPLVLHKRSSAIIENIVYRIQW